MDHNNQMMFRKPCIWCDIVEINLLIQYIQGDHMHYIN